MNSRYCTPILCGLAAVAALAADAPRQLGPKDSGRSIVLKTGETLEVRLPAQLGTGYGWRVTAPAAALLAQDGEAKTEPAAMPAPGGPEVQVFRFTVRAAGQADLSLDYARSFEPGSKPLRSVTYHLKVPAGPG